MEELSKVQLVNGCYLECRTYRLRGKLGRMGAWHRGDCPNRYQPPR